MGIIEFDKWSSSEYLYRVDTCDKKALIEYWSKKNCEKEIRNFLKEVDQFKKEEFNYMSLGEAKMMTLVKPLNEIIMRKTLIYINRHAIDELIKNKYMQYVNDQGSLLSPYNYSKLPHDKKSECCAYQYVKNTKKKTDCSIIYDIESDENTHLILKGNDTKIKITKNLILFPRASPWSPYEFDGPVSYKCLEFVESVPFLSQLDRGLHFIYTDMFVAANGVLRFNPKYIS